MAWVRWGGAPGPIPVYARKHAHHANTHSAFGGPVSRGLQVRVQVRLPSGARRLGAQAAETVPGVSSLAATSHTSAGAFPGQPDLKPCARRPWPGLNAWHSPSMFSEAASASCLAVTWSNPAPSTAPAFRGETRRALLERRGSTQKTGLPTHSHLRSLHQPHCVTASFLCSEEVMPRQLRGHFDGASGHTQGGH